MIALSSTFLIVELISIEAQINDKNTKEPLTGATILLEGTTRGAAADIDVNYKLIDLVAGIYFCVIRISPIRHSAVR